MRTILFLIRKEFLQIFRNKFISKAIFAVPIVQMLILVPAVTFEIKKVNLVVIDRDLSPESRALTGKLTGSTFFRVTASGFSEDEANSLIHKGKCQVVLHIPDGFSEKTGRGEQASLQASVDAINATSAQLSWAYLNSIIMDFSREMAASNALAPAASAIPLIKVTNRYWYNEALNYKYYMLPGILVILVTAIGFLLAGLNMVREKEIGTIEQINVTPVRKHQFIIAKMVPFLLIGLADLAIGLTIGRIAFSVPFEGNVLLMFFSSTIFLTGVLGLALFISTFSATQQQFMFIAFFCMIVFILMSGIFTPFESMPGWAQTFNLINPVAYLIKVNRMLMLKGSTASDLLRELVSLSALAIAFTTLAVNRYRKIA